MVVARRPFTVEEYHRMRDTGVFAEDDRLELLDGEVLLLCPIGPLHAAIVRRLNTLLSQMIGSRYLLSVQDPIHLSVVSEPQPDLVVLQYRADYYGTSHRQPSDIKLLVEVSDTFA